MSGQNYSKWFRITLAVIVLGMTTACESDTDRQAIIQDAEIKVMKSEQRAMAAEAKMMEMSGKVQEAERGKAAASEARQAAEKDLVQAKAEASMHTTLNVIFLGMIIAAYIAGLRQGEGKKKDNDAIRQDAAYDDSYNELYVPATNAGACKPRSSCS